MLSWIRWVSNERLVAGVRFAAHRSFVGTEETRLLSVRPDGSGLIELVRAPPLDPSRAAQVQDRVIDWLPDDGRHVLLQLTEGNSAAPGVYKVDVETGRRVLVHAPQRDVRRWITDAGHRVRVGVKAEDNDFAILACDPDGRNWRTLWSFKRFSSDAVWPLGFGRNPQELYVRAHHEGRDAVFMVDLASRGYAVLQVNFRGSSGYGHDFMAAGLQRWGLEMQDDLTDAVQWAIAQGLADPARVCIMGSSYGGYAALMGAVKTPRLYRCAISFAGITDLPDLIAHRSDYVGGLAAAQAQLGDAWRDRDRLRATSPALNAEHIEVPVLLVHGTADRIVPVEQARAMARALHRAGKVHRYIEQANGDHHLSRFSHRLAFYQAVEAFLAEHLRR